MRPMSNHSLTPPFGPQDVEVLERETPFQGFFRVDTLTLRHKHYNGGWGEPVRRELFVRPPAAAGLPYDPVARFHLGNGAILHAVHADADISPKGRKQSGGAMVNYLYDLKKIEENHDAFVTRQEVATSDAVDALAKAAATKQN